VKTEVLPLLKDCPDRCPGCQHRDWSQAESEGQKWDWLRRQLSPWEDVLEPVRGVENSQRVHYRNKVCLHAQWDTDHWRFGLRVRRQNAEPFSDTEVIHIPKCPIHSVEIQKRVETLSQTLPPSESFPLVYLSLSGALLTFVVKASEVDPQIVRSLQEDYDWRRLGIEGVWLNLNPSAGHRVFSSRGWVLIWGASKASQDTLIYGPDSFQQLIPDLHQDALREAQRFLLGPGLDSAHPAESAQRREGVRPSRPDVAILDLYSGVGRSLQFWQQLGLPCIGVELSGDAFECLQLNLKEAVVLRGRVSERIPQLELWRRDHEQFEICAYVNPPRLGLEPEVTAWLAGDARPRRLAYLSCSAGTLRRDLMQLVQAGYHVQRILPYDFFPGTLHVETLVLMGQETQV
jgi:23S rRNA (uracil1939-C5)-methyltransferase